MIWATGEREAEMKTAHESDKWLLFLTMLSQKLFEFRGLLPGIRMTR